MGKSGEIPKLCKKRHNLNYLGKTIALFFITVIIGFPVFYLLLLWLLGQSVPIYDVGGTILLLLLALGGLICLFGFVVCVYRWINVKRGALAKSVRKQCENPDEIDELEMFREIDGDIAGRNLRFGALYIGNEWALSAQAMRLSFVRGIFAWKDTARAGTKRQTSYNLALVDLNGNAINTSLMPDDQRAAYQYLTGKIPHAYQGGKTEYLEFFSYKEEKRMEFNRRFLEHAQPILPNTSEAFNYFGLDRIPTSRFDWSMIEGQMRQMATNQSIGLIAVNPFPCPHKGESLSLYCKREDEEYGLTAMFLEKGEVKAFVKKMGLVDAVRIFRDYMENHRLPSLTSWQSAAVELPAEEQKEKYVLHVDRQEYPNNTFEDVLAVLDGMDAKQYKSFYLALPSFSTGYLAVSRKSEPGYMVGTVLVINGVSRHYELLEPSRERVLRWLHAYYFESQLPDVTGWPDITEETECSVKAPSRSLKEWE